MEKQTNWVERYYYPRPTEPQLWVERVPVPDTTCPACGDDDVRRYPIANQYGPRMTVKCQACMHILSVERPGPDDMWPPYRSVTFDWKPAPTERPRQSPAGAETKGGEA
jgi:hypothetical protein